MYDENTCPQCIGTGELYDKKIDNIKDCHICKGSGKVNSVIYSSYYDEDVV